MESLDPNLKELINSIQKAGDVDELAYLKPPMTRKQVVVRELFSELARKQMRQGSMIDVKRELCKKYFEGGDQNAEEAYTKTNIEMLETGLHRILHPSPIKEQLRGSQNNNKGMADLVFWLAERVYCMFQYDENEMAHSNYNKRDCLMMIIYQLALLFKNRIKKHRFLYIQAEPNAGKTTLTECLRQIFGDYIFDIGTEASPAFQLEPFMSKTSLHIWIDLQRGPDSSLL